MSTFDADVASAVGTTSGSMGAWKAVTGGVGSGNGVGDLDDWPTIRGAGMVSHNAGVLPDLEGDDIFGMLMLTNWGREVYPG